MPDSKEYKTRWGRVLKKLSPQNIQKGIRYLRYYGIRQFLVRLQERFTPDEQDYMAWFSRHRVTGEECEKQKQTTFPDSLLISVAVPAYETPEPVLRQMVDSVCAQSFTNWELCIADGSESSAVERVIRSYRDARIKYQHLPENGGIAENTNAALRLASGTYTALLDHDDILEPDALFCVADRIVKAGDPDLLYTDEDKADTEGKEYLTPHFKPDFNLDLLRANNYICHLLVVRTALIRQTGGFQRDFDGAQDYDFILRCVEKARKIEHIPRILYHWRTSKSSTSDNPQSKRYAFAAGKRALEAHLARIGVAGEVTEAPWLGFYRVRYPVQDKPLVSILIPSKDETETLKTCLASIRSHTKYENYEILIIENNSEKEQTFAYYSEINGKDNCRVITWKSAFNYSAINNFAAQQARGEYLVLLNNDTEMITDGWMEELLGMCQRPEVGIVGTKLYYPDDTIQHAGTVVGIGGVAGHLFIGMKRNRSGYMHKAGIVQDLSAVTAAALIIRRSVFEQIGGFDEKLTIAFNDVDLCLRARKAGYLVVYDPCVELYHYESKSRGLEDDKQKTDRFKAEIRYMKEKWKAFLEAGDPCYNPNLTLKKSNYSIKR